MPPLLSLRDSVALGILAFSACTSSDEGAERSLTRTDSLGVAIVTSIVPVGDLGPVLSLSSEPRLRIGVEDGAEELLFSEIRSIARLADGRIAVANGTPPEIRVFGDRGEFQVRLGRSGRGPGEFQYLGRVLAGTGDTVMAVNFPSFQLMRFDLRAGYIDMIAHSREGMVEALDSLRPREGIREFLRSGSLVLTAAGMEDVPDGRPRPVGELYRPTSRMAWVSADLEQSTVLGTFGEIQQMFVQLDGGRRTPLVPPNARTLRSALGGRGRRFCVAGNDAPEVRCVDDDGAQLIIRWNQEDVPTTEADIETWRAEHRERAQRPGFYATPQTVEQMISQVIVPPTKPPVSLVLVDAERRVMVSGPDLEAVAEGWRRFRVFAASGELLGVADLPPVTVHDLGPDYLLGVSRDEDGIEFVVAYEVSQMPSP